MNLCEQRPGKMGLWVNLAILGLSVFQKGQYMTRRFVFV